MALVKITRAAATTYEGVDIGSGKRIRAAQNDVILVTADMADKLELEAPSDWSSEALGAGGALNVESGALLQAGGTMTGDLTMTGGEHITLGAGSNVVLDATTGSKIGTATTQKLGFYNATPVVQPANTSDVKDALIALGLLATGGATPLNLDGGAITAGDSNTLGSFTITDGKDVTIGTTTGTKFGAGATAKIGFFGATPVVQQAGAAQAECPAGGTGQAAGGWDTAEHRDAAIALINAMRTALINLGLIKGSA